MSRHGATRGLLLLAALVAVWLAQPVTPAARQSNFVINHSNLGLFDEIPSAYKTAAAALRMMFLDRSVGANIWSGLTCMQSELSDPDLPSYCDDWQGNTPEAWTGTWDSTEWVFVGEPGVGLPNESGCTSSDGQWTGVQACWIEHLSEPGEIDNWDVVSFQLSYLGGLGATPVLYFTPSGSYSDVADWESFVASISPKQAFFWTTSVNKTDVPSPGMLENLDDYNVAARSHFGGTSYPLLDFADIITHDLAGNACAYGGFPAICEDYCGEVHGGHLTTGQGVIRAAKAVWIMMAVIAGWDPTDEPGAGIPLPLRRVKG